MIHRLKIAHPYFLSRTPKDSPLLVNAVPGPVVTLAKMGLVSQGRRSAIIADWGGGGYALLPLAEIANLAGNMI